MGGGLRGGVGGGTGGRGTSGCGAVVRLGRMGGGRMGGRRMRGGRRTVIGRGIGRTRGRTGVGGLEGGIG